ncbi:putative transmembrane permease [Trichormus variabilis ATCC 29413]|uniref:Transmembrane permease n=2 Tax=Anabaena variabilis TaxID=264691 RepID=Q3MBK6_TRIV2|nr:MULTISPECIES: MFS transporter [Nostocaceae]ABA21630.1 putative transmembrane permease [Trichormus variabilis ATCC 29413]MBC1216538.1 MFS transporter [Trichormus variabilis ARAD]MBC1257104.1 MFS transporter [Trichormus variabilis V5]MBC1268717.1 MFS transporter [Trichormus variabilis FSR]MBC1304843.1 MFS transporter [Trichormus variabilis N2B]
MKYQARFTSPWAYIPILYFASGVPYVIINTVSVIFYKKLGIANTQIAFWTSFLYLPWVIKMFWGPIVDVYSTKRQWILYTQFAMCACLAVVAFCLQLPNFFFISLAALTIGAFISANYDIATDGFYLLALNPDQQAFFVGVRSLFYRLAVIFGSGFLVVFAGQLETYLNDIPLSWTLAIGSATVILAMIYVSDRLILPFPESDNPRELQASSKIPFLKIITSYFQQPKILAILAFILLYRFGEAMLLKIASLFLLDKPELGGLGLTTSDVGLVYGTFGVISLICGGILGGLAIAKYGLKKCLLPMALALNLPDLFYVYMAYNQPPLTLVYPLVSLEQFGYGFGFTAFSVYLMYISQGEYKTSHFAISTGIMALGMMLPGIVSGYLQNSLGYPLFFVLVCVLTIPGMISLFFIPLPEETNHQTS